MSLEKKINFKIYNDIGDYIITNKRIGKGSFSSIFIGFDKYNTDNIFAIKKIQVDTVTKLNKNIKREIELHQKINHRNIIKIYKVIYDNTIHNNNIFLILEYCSRGDFYNFQKKRPIREHYIKKYINDLKEGLKYLYDKNIIHRDLKTKNLLMSNCGDIKIADFGFAKIFNKNNLDLKQTYCGSPLYMAPEILYYQKYDNKSDLWSVGIIIYEMITGNPPYHVKNFYQLMKALEKSDIELPDNYKVIISTKLQYLLKHLLVKNPNKRMDWLSFFNNSWIQNTKLNDENNLLDIDIYLETGKSLPNLHSSNYLNTKDIFYNIKNDKYTVKEKNIIKDKKLNNLFDEFNTYSNNNKLKNSKIDYKNQNKNTKIKFTDQLNSINFNKSELHKKNINNSDNLLNFNLVFNSSVTSSHEPDLIDENYNSNEEDLYLSAKSFVSIDENDIEINNTSGNSSDKTSFEIINNFSHNLSIDSLNNIKNNISSVKEIDIEKNKKKKGIFYNSINVLKESYDYLSSHNKSI